MDIGYMKIIPRPGLSVRFPRTYAILPESGAVVPWIGADGRYWRRRVDAGDVIVVVEEEKQIAKPAAPIRKINEEKEGNK